MALSRNSVQRAGDRAILMSEEIQTSDEPMCMSFWYYMYEPIVGNTGPELGKLNVWVRSEDRYFNVLSSCYGSNENDSIRVAISILY